MNDQAAEIGIAAPNVRLPSNIRLGRVILQIAHLERSVEFYERVIGLSVIDRRNGRAVLGTSDGRSALIELVEQPGAQPVPPRGLIGLFHVAILLPDRPSLGAFLRHLSELGVRAGMSDHLVSEAIYLSDPDGLGLEVYADRPRAVWRQQGQQIAMTTEPLDVRSVIESAAGIQWNGVASGTRIGHVHLHVGDLAGAEAFYHETLGLDKVVWSYPGALFLSAGGYHHHLGVNTWAAGASPATADDARMIAWTIELPDEQALSDAAACLESAGAEIARADGGIQTADPWGTGLRLSIAD